jgi:1-pyrroline-5-carboxylate dehydrogenase
LEGFIYAVSPFNFTAIGGNLPTAPAIAGNVVVWKPASAAVYSNHFLMQILKEAGLPDGVINFIPGRSSKMGSVPLHHPQLAGLHFTGSTQTFRSMWRMIGENISNYRGYPRVVGETGGKNFVFVHVSADVDEVATAVVRALSSFRDRSAPLLQALRSNRFGRLKNRLKRD